MGMSPYDYWCGPSDLKKAYRQARDIRKQEENERLWLQGMYFYEAVSVALHNSTGNSPLKSILPSSSATLRGEAHSVTDSRSSSKKYTASGMPLPEKSVTAVVGIGVE